MRLPRRLRHGEEATLVEHLDELRRASSSSLIALIVLRDRRVRLPAPDPPLAERAAARRQQRKLTTLGVAEPFLVTFKISLWVGLRRRVPGHPLADLGLLRAGGRGAHAARRRRASSPSRRCCSSAGSPSATTSCCRRRCQFLTHYNDKHVQHPDPRERLLQLRPARARRRRRRLRAADLRARARAARHPHLAPAAAHAARSATSSSPSSASLLPGIDPVTTTLETMPLFVLYEGSIWLAGRDGALLGRTPRRPARAACEMSSQRGLGRPRRGGRRSRTAPWRSATTAASPPSGTAAELGEGEHFEDAVILPASSTRTRISSTRRTRGSATGSRSRRGSGSTSRARAGSTADEMEAIARLGAAECLRSGITTVGDCSFCGAAADRVRRARAAGDRLPRGLRRGRQARSSRFDELAGERRGRLLRPCPRRESRRTRRTRARRALRGLRRRSACRSRPTSRRARPSSSTCSRARPLGVARRVPRATARAAARSRRWPRPACSGPLVAAHCVQVDEEEIALLAALGVGVAHCPRSNALLGCGVAPLAALREAGVRVAIAHRQPGLDAVVRHVRRAARRGDGRARARAAAGRAARQRTRSSSRRSAARGRSASTHEIGSLDPGQAGRPDGRSRSPGSPFLPWEDPVGAVVLGGSPDRIVATLVDGDERYRRGGDEWHASTSAAQRARARMLERVTSTPTPRQHGARRSRTRCSSPDSAATRSGCSCSSRSFFGLGFVALRRRRERHRDRRHLPQPPERRTAARA